MARPVDRPAAVGVFAYARRRSGKTVKVVVTKMHFHIPEAHDFIAQVTFGRARSVHKFVRREPGKENRWVSDVWI